MRQTFFLFIFFFLILTGIGIFSESAPKKQDVKGGIEIPRDLRLIYPNASGIILEAGSYITITWMTVSQIDKVELRYSTNNGLDYPNVITSFTSTGNSSGSYMWQVPTTTAHSLIPNIKIKVIDLKDNDIYDESDNAFLIRGKIVLNVFFSNGAGRVLIEGDICVISWTTIGIIDGIKLEYSINNFSPSTPTGTWKISNHPINNVSNGNTLYNWIIPGKASSSVNLRVSSTADNSVYCISNNFQIAGKAMSELEVNNIISRIEKNISAVRTLQSVFIQEKKLAVFNDKIILKGRIFLEKPDFFAWHVNTPLKYSIVVTGDSLRQWDEDSNQVQEVSLAKNPGFQVLITELKKWLSGKYSDLVKEYSVKIQTQSPLAMEFSPREKFMSYNLISRVVVLFTENESSIDQVLVEKKSGDSSLLIFSDTRLNEKINPAVWDVKNYGR